MKLFILAAGTGTRLLPLTKNTPKSLIDLGDGTTLLERQISNAINSALFSEIVILTGYRTEQIEAKIKEYERDIKISTIFNPFYDTTNNLVSLWLANPQMLEKDFMITNGDNRYKENVYNEVYSDNNEIIQVTINYNDKYDDDDMKVTLNDDGTIVKIHKEIPLSDTHAESVGLALIKGEKSRKIFSDRLIQLVIDKDYLNTYWLVVFNALVDDGILIKTKEISKQDWREMDFHPDKEALRKMIFKGF